MLLNFLFRYSTFKILLSNIFSAISLRLLPNLYLFYPSLIFFASLLIRSYHIFCGLQMMSLSFWYIFLNQTFQHSFFFPCTIGLHWRRLFLIFLTGIWHSVQLFKFVVLSDYPYSRIFISRQDPKILFLIFFSQK